jgi:hypothetical protein
MIKWASASELAECVLAAWKIITGERWNSHSRNAELQMHFMEQNDIVTDLLRVITVESKRPTIARQWL